MQCREQYPGGGVLGSSFAGYVPLASQNLYPIIVYSVASYRPHLSHFLANVIVISRTEFNASRLLNNKTTAGTIFQLRIFLFLNPCLPEFSYPENPENLRPHSSNSTKIVNPIIVSPVVKYTPRGTILGMVLRCWWVWLIQINDNIPGTAEQLWDWGGGGTISDSILGGYKTLFLAPPLHPPPPTPRSLYTYYWLGSRRA